MEEPTGLSEITDLFTTGLAGATGPLLAVAAIGVGVFVLSWGIPAAKKFFKKTAS